jgi:hypothetical protein
VHNFLRTQGVGRFNNTYGSAGYVVIIRPQEPRMFGCLAADQSRAGREARIGDALDNGRDAFGNNLSAGNVIRHEQGPRTGHNDVIDDHTHEILTDGVVLVERLSDGHLGAHAIRAGSQERAIKVFNERDVEQTSESADTAKNLGAMRRFDGGLH